MYDPETKFQHLWDYKICKSCVSVDGNINDFLEFMKGKLICFTKLHRIHRQFLTLNAISIMP